MKRRIFRIIFVLMIALFAMPAYAVKKPTQVTNLQVVQTGTSSQTLTWDRTEHTTGYKVYVKSSEPNSKYKRLITLRSKEATSYVVTDRQPGVTYTYKVKAYRKTKKGKIYYGKYSAKVSGMIPAKDQTGILVRPSLNKKNKKIFGQKTIVGKPGAYYTTESVAASNMETITVETWDFKTGNSGKKITRTWSLTVHKNLAPTVQQIFKEIYEGKEQFPIHSLGGFRYEGGNSEHNIGTAIDINYIENYMINSSGQIMAGSYWKPGIDPYSIPVDGEVAEIFRKYGFSQGSWSSIKDYMHFSYFGT